MTVPVRARPPRRRSRRVPRPLLTAALVCAAFLLGIALGMALHDNPKPGGTQTIVRTFVP